MKPIKQTLQDSYKKIAPTYFQANNDKVLTTHIEKFVTLVKPNGLVLDVGCGTGRDTAVLQSHNLHVVGLDLTFEMMVYGRKNGNLGHYVQAEMQALPIAQGVDGIWASASLLHLPPDHIPETLSQFHHLLAPNGIFYCTIKQGDGDAWTPISYQEEAPRYFNYWQAEPWNTQLETAGFTIVDGWTIHDRTVPWLVRFCKKNSET